MAYDRQKVDLLRQISLKKLFENFGFEPDPNDKNQYKTDLGRISIEQDEKFFNHDMNVGGGGAIDFIMHFENLNFNDAIKRLSSLFLNENITHYARQPKIPKVKKEFVMPSINDNTVQIVSYLKNRCISEEKINSLLLLNVLFADKNNNIVFPLKNIKGQIIGAEQKGTMPNKKFSRVLGDKGFFVFKNTTDKTVYFCESPIDAISLSESKDGLFISTGGENTTRLLEFAAFFKSRDFRIVAAFDNDAIGQKYTESIKDFIDEILIPIGKDWNEDLQNELLQEAKKIGAKAPKFKV